MSHLSDKEPDANHLEVSTDSVRSGGNHNGARVACRNRLRFFWASSSGCWKASVTSKTLCPTQRRPKLPGQHVVSQSRARQHIATPASHSPAARRIECALSRVADDFEDDNEAIDEAVLTPYIVSKMVEADVNLLRDDEGIAAIVSEDEGDVYRRRCRPRGQEQRERGRD